MFSCSSFAEKRVERIISITNCFIARHLAIGLNSMFQAIQLPARIANLASSLANVYWNTFTLEWKRFSKNWDRVVFTAVASMRRTEALASVKFYQILSIFIFFIRLIILEDFIRLISYNGPCVRLGCSFFLATALVLHPKLKTAKVKDR